MYQDRSKFLHSCRISYTHAFRNARPPSHSHNDRYYPWLTSHAYIPAPRKYRQSNDSHRMCMYQDRSKFLHSCRISYTQAFRNDRPPSHSHNDRYYPWLTSHAHILASRKKGQSKDSHRISMKNHYKYLRSCRIACNQAFRNARPPSHSHNDRHYPCLPSHAHIPTFRNTCLPAIVTTTDIILV